jgi:hypothetical protein
MELSIFYAKLLGIYLLIVAADLLFRRKEIEGAVKDFASSKGLLVFSGSISLLLGLTIVLSHPMYETPWQMAITWVGYLLILRGVWRMAFPSHLQKKLFHCFHKGYWVIFIIIVALGYYLANAGFTASAAMMGR